MPHLSDGELHAYLDGALDHLPETRAEEIREHLRTCGACRSRVAEERELLERSSAILEAGGPAEVEAPPLEELRERARIREEQAARERGRGWRTMPRSQAMAWAATVVLALGIGWMTRDLTGVRSPLWRPALESTSVGAPQGEAVPAESRDRGPAAEEDGTPPPEASPAPPRGEARSRAEAAEREAQPTAPPGVADAPADEPIAETAEDRGDARPSMGPTVVGRVVDEASLEPLSGAPVVLEDSAGVRHGGTLTQSDGRFTLRAERPGTYRAVVEMIGYTGASTDFFELSHDDTVARDVRTPAQALSLDAITVTGVRAEEMEAAEGVARRMVPETAAAAAADVTVPEERDVVSAERRPGAVAFDEMTVTGETASLHVPGLPVLSVEFQDPGGVLILQRLATGDTLHLRWLAGSARENADAVGRALFRIPRPEGWSEVVLRREDGWLVARAPLSEEELRALLARER